MLAAVLVVVLVTTNRSILLLLLVVLLILALFVCVCVTKASGGVRATFFTWSYLLMCGKSN